MRIQSWSDTVKRRFHPGTLIELISDLYRIFASTVTYFTSAHKNHANTIIFCSVTTPGLISIKALLRSYRDIVCLVVPHDILQEVTMVPSLRPHRLFFSFRLWISFGNTHRLRYVVLGPRIEERLKQLRASGEQLRELYRSSLLLQRRCQPGTVRR